MTLLTIHQLNLEEEGGGALAVNLEAYWSLEEASGDAIDATGNVTDLTDTNTVTAGTGKVGGGRDFESGNSEQFTHADTTELSTGDVDFSFNAWVKIEAKAAGNHCIIAKDGANGGEYYFYYDGNNDRFALQVYGSAAFADGSTVLASTFGAPSTDTWYMVSAGHNATANEIWIAVNAGTPDTDAHTAGGFNSDGTFRMGADQFGDLWDGMLDEVGIWKRDIRDDLDDLYNGGAGLSYDDINSGGAETFTGSAAVTIGAATASGAAAFTPPTFLGSGSRHNWGSDGFWLRDVRTRYENRNRGSSRRGGHSQRHGDVYCTSLHGHSGSNCRRSDGLWFSYVCCSGVYGSGGGINWSSDSGRDSDICHGGLFCGGCRNDWRSNRERIGHVRSSRLHGQCGSHDRRSDGGGNRNLCCSGLHSQCRGHGRRSDCSRDGDVYRSGLYRDGRSSYRRSYSQRFGDIRRSGSGIGFGRSHDRGSDMQRAGVYRDWRTGVRNLKRRGQQPNRFDCSLYGYRFECGGYQPVGFDCSVYC
jgi:hypothetical protein